MPGCRCTWRKVGSCNAELGCVQNYECVENGNFDPESVVCPEVRTKQEPCDSDSCLCKYIIDASQENLRDITY